VRKIYKLNNSSSVGKKSKIGNGESSNSDLKHINGVYEEVDEFQEMEAMILGIMVLKGS
jgi:hypothetical protein